MPAIQETIPAELADAAEAARAWFSRERGSEFGLTGIVDPPHPDTAGAADGPQPAQRLRLILCGRENGQDACLREDFDVTPTASGFQVEHVRDATPDLGSPAPLLDPPAGVRAGWLDQTLARHAFVVLIFYRGFW